MPFAKHFYYNKKTEKSVYTHVPEGSLDVSRLIKNLAYWKKTTLPSEQKQKTLILADWTAFNWSTEKINAVQKQFTALIDEGFILYARQKNEIVLLTKGNLTALNDKNFRKAITPAFPEEIIEHAVIQHQHTHDQILILDDYWIQSLLNKNDRVPIIRTLDLTDLAMTPFQDKAFALIKKATPKLDAIEHSEFSKSSNESQHEILRDLPGIRINRNFRTITLNSNDDLRELLKKDTLVLSGVLFTASNLITIETLNLKQFNLDSNLLQDILNRTPILRILNLSDCYDMDDITRDLNLPNLEALFLERSSINNSSLQKLLAKSNKLKTLNLERCKNITGDFTTDAFKLSYLNSLNLSASNITSGALQKVLVKTPQLQFLQLENCKNISEEFSNDLDLSHLKVLDLSHSTISSASLQKLLAKTPHLTKLDLNNCENISGAISKDLDLSHLEVLDLSYSTISSASLQKVLVKATQLKTLKLDGCKNISEDLSDDLNLAHLESLDLHFSTISSASLQKLLAKASQLKTVRLSLCKNISGELSNDLNLSHLEILNLSQSTISSASLQKLLAKTPHLTNLNLYHCENISEELPNDLDLSRLESLDLSYSTISSASLQKVLAKTPHLAKLDLHNCKNVTIEFILPDLNLPDLEHLNLEFINISSAALQKLVTQMPKLKNLDLSYCHNLQTDFTRDLNLPHLETLNLRGSSISSINVQQLISNARVLRVLTLRECQNLTASFTKDLYLPHLEELNLFDSEINITSLQKLLAHTPQLKSLNLKDCDRIKGNFTKDLALPLLTYLDINYYRITQKGMKQLLAQVPENSPLWSELRNHLSRDNKAISNTTPMSQPADPVHNAMDKLDFKPLPKDDLFEYKGLNQTRNQGMLIEKLSQYLTLSTQHTDSIPQLQNGICTALTRLFLDKSVDEWNKFNDQITAWNGTKETLDDNPQLKTSFEMLWEYTRKYQLNPSADKPRFIGDAAVAFLTRHPQDFILSNPWHAISLKYTKKNKSWIVYDPNFVNGARLCTEKDLPNVLKSSLGSLVGVWSSIPIQLVMPSPLLFIREGGLLALCTYENAQDLLPLAPSPPKLRDEDLDGILLRNTKGIPAWAQAIQEPRLAPYTMQLLEEFKTRHPSDYKYRLKQSLGALTPKECHYLIDSLTHLQKSHLPLIKNLNSILHHPPEDMPTFELRLQTWIKDKSEINSYRSYCQQLLNGSKKKQLIELSSTEDLNAMNLIIQHYCINTTRALFYIDSPEDLICSAPYMKRIGKKGILTKGPGGPLHDFLIAEYQAPPVLLINYDNFEPDDIVRLNSLLDETRYADGTPVPESTLIIGLINPNKANCYQGEDFYSRFDHTETCPLTSSVLSQEIPSLPIIEATPEQQVVPIQLFHAEDWEERLLGRWVINHDALYFEKGILAAALETGLPLEIHNGRWDLPKFNLFWQQASLRGSIEYAGELITIPGSLKIIKKTGYDWEKLTTGCLWERGVSKGAPVLNPSLLTQFFNQYECNNENQTLASLPGLISIQANKEFHLNLTRELDEDQWAMILDACQKHQVQLYCHALPGVNLPMALQTKLLPSAPTPPAAWNGEQYTSLVINSTDADTTTQLLLQEDKDWMVLDVSECDASDLLTHLDGHLNKDKLIFEFTKTDQALLQGLKEQKKIILRGYFSPALIDALTPLLLARQAQNEPKGQLVLINTGTISFNTMPVYTHQADATNKRNCLKKTNADQCIRALTDQQVEKEPLSRLNARLKYLKKHPEQSSDMAWKGMEGIAGGIHLEALDMSNSEKQSAAFVNKRLDALMSILHNEPYVFLTGLTAVGKTSFVEKIVSKKCSVLYQGEDNLYNWAIDKSPGLKILFIDEANLSKKQWSEFEGLFNTPPELLINGKNYLLQEDHKVIFAGNPLSYGEGRQLAPLFMRHGNALQFEPLPLAFIYEEILKPVWSMSPLEKIATDASLHFLNVYRFLCEHSREEVLISPREIQMMALLTASTYQKNPQQDLLSLAKHYAYLLAKPLVPEAQQAEFNHQFATLPIMHTKQYDSNTPSFLTTQSRQVVSQQLEDILTLREKRQTDTGSNEAQLYGGLGGLVLEGSPGIGKSEQVMSTLIQHGYHEVKYPHCATTPKPFYRMPVSMQTEDKNELLIQAFNEGAVVIIDEINSSPMMERLLNALLMGKTPDGKRPANPGFTVIGTQNPATMAGRHLPSKALARRVTTITLEDYSPKEMKQILINKGVAPHNATSLVSAYQRQVSTAKEQNLKPAPTFRDLQKLAKEVITTQGYKYTPPAKNIKTEPCDTTPLINTEWLTLIQQAAKNAKDEYLKFHETGEHDRGYKSGFFSKIRHGQAGKDRASALVKMLSNTEDAQRAIDEIHTLLSNPQTRYHKHSFALYLLDHLEKAITSNMNNNLNNQFPTDSSMRQRKIIDTLNEAVQNSLLKNSSP